MEYLAINLTKRLESFAHCCSQSLLLADLKENYTYSFLLLNKPYKKIHETRKPETFHETHFVERKNEGRKPDKTQV